ncbi:prenyltransferase/squalene oxidase repeat-containing protein [Paramaledivibacter caminithermalis]|uniref:Prenyltransferase and squalene oxidase repeat-containing protein n=1 Tax=Paramaledivibacter caminithermalis (strain DSM 15212 / CIP 107654 / DViRD3) TaxID=1121301 RepID=A0A1M6MW83_PARC5|nr:prenyltransferase/squalene oxidase repeat-containing protein [Paramaledivibacter caminithermalis]SHJ87543.1 Prenyltransferase and squalene oxidase repeat-containing protein [Paramaledivibacter caminithermalis DSM 15212]
MKKIVKASIPYIIIFCLIFSYSSIGLNVYADSSSDDLYDKVLAAIDNTSNYMMNNSTFSSDWKVVGLVNAEMPIPESYLEDTEENIKQRNGYFMKVTDYERIVIGITAAGGNPRNIGGYDLLEKIYNFEDGDKDITFQGINGVIYALIALDSKNYSIPPNSKYDRAWLINYILDSQNHDGGWNLSGNQGDSDVDITAMALIALAPYHDYLGVSEKVENAVNWLSAVQREDNGGFNSWGSYDNCESVCQTIIGLCANGIDPTSEKFTKNGFNAIHALLSFAKEDGTFVHTKDNDDNIGMSTEQAYQALLAYDKFVEMGSEYCDGKNSIYYFGEEEKPVEDEDFKEFESREDIKADKIWSIIFNQKIQEGCVDTENVIIVDEYGEKHPIEVEIIDDNTAIKVTPKIPYYSGEKYTLYVKTKNVSNIIRSESGKELKQGIKMSFTIEN